MPTHEKIQIHCTNKEKNPQETHTKSHQWCTLYTCSQNPRQSSWIKVLWWVHIHPVLRYESTTSTQLPRPHRKLRRWQKKVPGGGRRLQTGAGKCPSRHGRNSTGWIMARPTTACRLKKFPSLCYWHNCLSWRFLNRPFSVFISDVFA